MNLLPTKIFIQRLQDHCPTSSLTTSERTSSSSTSTTSETTLSSSTSTISSTTFSSSTSSTSTSTTVTLTVTTVTLTVTTVTTTTATGPGPCIVIDPANTTAWGYNRTFYGTEGITVSIGCVSPTPTLTVISAFYGRNNGSACNCTKMDVTQKVQTKCNITACNFAANNPLFTDTCSGVAKIFWMYYTCTL